MEGLDGLEKMARLMDRLRNNPPSELAGYRVVERRDYLKDIVLDIDTGKVAIDRTADVERALLQDRG